MSRGGGVDTLNPLLPSGRGGVADASVDAKIDAGGEDAVQASSPQRRGVSRAADAAMGTGSMRPSRGGGSSGGIGVAASESAAALRRYRQLVADRADLDADDEHFEVKLAKLLPRSGGAVGDGRPPGMSWRLRAVRSAGTLPCRRKCCGPLWYYSAGEVLSGTLLVLGILFLIVDAAVAPVKVAVQVSGDVAEVMLVLTLATASRNSVWMWLFGVSWERAVLVHTLLGVATVVAGAIHADVHIRSQGWQWEQLDFFAAVVFWASTATLSLFALAPCRRITYDLFYYSHIGFSLLVVLFGIIHNAAALWAGGSLWFLDWLIRIVLMCRNNREGELLRLPNGIVRITVPRGNTVWRGGQHMFVCVPAIGAFEWHPLSISTAPFEKDIVLHARVVGDWTRALLKLTVPKGPTKVKVLLDGPYGEPSVDLTLGSYKTVVMICGGSGVSPMQSMANELLAHHVIGKPLHKLIFIWAVRDTFQVRPEEDDDEADDVALEMKRKSSSSSVGDELAVIVPKKSDKYDDHNVGLLPNRLPMSFQPDLLLQHVHSMDVTGDRRKRDDGRNRRMASADPLHTQFHLTRIRKGDARDFDANNIKPETQQCVVLGRPDLRKVFAAARAYASQTAQTRVAVLACGPPSLMRAVVDLSQQAQAASKNMIKFDTHTESFFL